MRAPGRPSAARKRPWSMCSRGVRRVLGQSLAWLAEHTPRSTCARRLRARAHTCAHRACARAAHACGARRPVRGGAAGTGLGGGGACGDPLKMADSLGRVFFLFFSKRLVISRYFVFSAQLFLSVLAVFVFSHCFVCSLTVFVFSLCFRLSLSPSLPPSLPPSLSVFIFSLCFRLFSPAKAPSPAGRLPPSHE